MGGSRQTSSKSSSARSSSSSSGKKPKERYTVWMKRKGATSKRIYTYAYSAKQAKHFAKYRLRGYTPSRAAKDPLKSVSGSEETSSKGNGSSKSTNSSVKRKTTTKQLQKKTYNSNNNKNNNNNNNNNNKKTTKHKSSPGKKKTGTKNSSSSTGSTSTKSNSSSSKTKIKTKTNNKKTIPPLKKNALGQYGYKLNKNQSERIKALKKAVKEQGYKSVVSRLVATANLTKTSQPQNHKKYRSDIRQLQGLYSKK